MTEGMVDLIRMRTSVRTFSIDPVPAELMTELATAAGAKANSLFGNYTRFVVTPPREKRFGQEAGLSTYGVVKNPYAFIVGAVSRGPGALTDYGYAMQKIILRATSLGLGTCWLGGTFSRSAFSRAIELQESELLPAVSPVGLPTGGKSLVDGFLSLTSRSRLRRSWGDTFYQGEPGVPLSPEDSGPYAEALESLRLAPSALNRQPWRVVKDPGADNYHFFILPSSRDGDIRFPEVDIGIALCHFELVAEDLGLEGAWVQKAEQFGMMREGWTYILSWESQ